jgi:hypothetical protein
VGKPAVEVRAKARRTRRAPAARIPVAPAEASYANIRVTATDQAGNKLSQTIERAWAVN